MLFFNGRLWVTPVTLSSVEDAAMFARGLGVGNVLALIGTSEGGTPNTPVYFQNPADAKAVLRGGNLLDAVERAFNPSAEAGTSGPQRICCIRVNPATQSTLVLNDSAAAAAITLTSTDYGLHTTGIGAQVQAGTTRGLKLTTRQRDKLYSSDNIFRDAFSVIYAGSGTGTIAITNSTVTLSLNSVVTAIPLAQYPTIRELVDRLNGVGGITALVLGNNDTKPALNGLDALTAADCKTAALTAVANLQAAVDWFNGQTEFLVNAVRTGTKPPAVVAFTNLAGGADGSVTNEQWSDAFDVLQTQDVQWVVPLSGDESIHIMAEAHASYMSTVAMMERRCILGTELDTSDDDALLETLGINSDRAALVHIGMYDYSDAGVYTLYPPWMLAALIAGAFSGVNPGTALTNKSLKVRGLERFLRVPLDTDRLILGGVMPIIQASNGYRVGKSCTTWVTASSVSTGGQTPLTAISGGANYNRTEISVGVALDYVARSMRNGMDSFRGAKGSPETLVKAKVRAESILTQLSVPEPAGIGVLVGDATNPPFRKLTVSLVGDIMAVQVEVSPVIPVNFIPITIFAVPFSASV